MSGVAVGTIANRIVLGVSGGGPVAIHEMTEAEAITVIGRLIAATSRVSAGVSFKHSAAEFLASFTA